MKKEIPFVIAYNGQHIEACSLDVSDNGICLKIFGSPSLPVGETIDFNVNDISVKAQVMWVTNNNSKISSAITGLQIVDGTVSTL